MRLPAKTRTVLTPVALGVLAALGPPQAPAAEPAVDTSNWKCESCPFQTAYESNVAAGALNADGTDASYSKYTGIEDDTYLDVSADGKLRRESGSFVEYELDDLGLDSRDARITAGREGRFDVTVRYDQLPYFVSRTTATPFAGAGGTSLSLPSGWVRSATTTGMTRLSSSLAPLDLEHERETLGLSARYLVGTRWSLFGGYSRQDKEGVNYVGSAFLTQSAQLPEPIDQSIDDWHLGVAWAGDLASARVVYTGSKFRNDALALEWANPYTAIVPTATLGRMALAPDNDLQQLAASMDVRFPFDSVVSFDASYGELTQDAAFLPVSTGSSARPAANLDGKVTLAHYGASFGSRPIPRLYVRGTLRYDEREDESPELTFPYVVTDTFAGGTVTAERYDYRRTRMDLTADYGLFRWLRVGGGVERNDLNRRNTETDRTLDEGQYARVRLTPGGGFAVTLKGGFWHREASGFDPAELSPGENPALRKYHMANRDRDAIEMLASWNATETVTLGLSGTWADNQYRRSPLGLQDARERAGALTLGWAPKDGLSFYVDGGYQRFRATQNGQQIATPWWGQHDDLFRNAGAGVKFGLLENRLGVGLDYAHASSSGRVWIDPAAPSAFQQYPETKTRLNSARIDLTWRLNPATSILFRYAYESYDQDDWAVDGVEPATVPTLLSLGADAYSHDVNLFGLSVLYRFGGGPKLPEEASE